MDLQQRQHHLTCYPQLSRRNIKTGKLTRNSLSKMLSKIKLSAKYPSPQDANAQLLAIRQVYFRSIIGSVLAHQKGCLFFNLYHLCKLYRGCILKMNIQKGGCNFFSFYIYLNIAPGYGRAWACCGRKYSKAIFLALDITAGRRAHG